MYASAQSHSIPVAQADDEKRAKFIRRTYGHLAVAILAFIGLESILLDLPIAREFTVYATSKYVWAGVLLVFMAVAAIAEYWARSQASQAAQYFGLGLYVVAEAVIFVPLLTIAKMVSPDIIPTAALLTGVLTGGLTLICFSTRANFSGMRNFLCIAGFVALGLIFSSIIFGFGLGLLFSAAMILLAGGMILYSTSCVIHEYNTDQHVAAALSLFAAIALLFWYVVRILIELYARYQGEGE
jgi:FtsH-binding integral membrane protein